MGLRSPPANDRRPAIHVDQLEASDQVGQVRLELPTVGGDVVPAQENSVVLLSNLFQWEEVDLLEHLSTFLVTRRWSKLSVVTPPATKMLLPIFRHAWFILDRVPIWLWKQQVGWGTRLGSSWLPCHEANQRFSFCTSWSSSLSW